MNVPQQSPESVSCQDSCWKRHRQNVFYFSSNPGDLAAIPTQCILAAQRICEVLPLPHQPMCISCPFLCFFAAYLFMFMQRFHIVSGEKYNRNRSFGVCVVCGFTWAPGVLQGMNQIGCGAISWSFAVFQASELWRGWLASDWACCNLDWHRSPTRVPSVYWCGPLIV